MSAFSDDDLAVIGAAFGCGGELAATVAGALRHAFVPRGRRLWPGLGDDADGEAILMLAGRAHELAFGRDGGMVVVHAIGAGDLFGDLLGTAGADGGSEVHTVAYSRCGHVPAMTLVRWMECYSAIALAVARQISTKLERVRGRMVDTVLLSATGRICAELVRMAEAGDSAVIAPMPQVSELAVIAQTTRETASRTISKLLKRGILLREEDGLRVVALHRLKELVH